MDHLPEAERPWVRRKLRAAWANPNANEAEAALRALAGQLEKVNPDAAASLREGLAETLTVTRLGITGSLLKTVMSTNPVKSMIEIVREHARNWPAACCMPAVKGYQQLPKLADVLRRTVVERADESPVAVTA